MNEENKSKLRLLSQQWGASLFGVARLEEIPRDQILLPARILDQLPLALSIGFHLSDAVIEDIENQPTPLYFHHYQRVNILLDTIGLRITSAIQEMGYQALPVPASQIVDWKNQKGHLSHKRVARLAGLGWIGRNNLLVNNRFGSRIRLVTILTNLPLEIDLPTTKDCGTCRACLSVCPAGAISERVEDFDHLRCYEKLRTFSKTLHFSHHICGVCVRACQGPK